MRYADLTEEKKLWGIGFRSVVGLDEAGRGPLAGPVVAAAVCLKSDVQQVLPKIRDSKKLSDSQRSELYGKLTEHPAVSFGVGVISEKIIDEVNILEATKLAMHKALEQLGTHPDMLLIDGNFPVYARIPQQSISGADERVYSCSAAGIIAKVTRDRIMHQAHALFPDYGFDRHKGYGTALHLAKLDSLGPCQIHRMTFYPVSTVAKN
ncbi:MAG: ribonuclease HII [Candidatus Saccharimonadales bacterium]